MSESRRLSQWRTVGLAAFGIIALVLGLLICGHLPAASGQFPAFSGAVTGIIVAAAAKAGWEHRENARAATKAGEPAATVLAQGATG